MAKSGGRGSWALGLALLALGGWWLLKHGNPEGPQTPPRPPVATPVPATPQPAVTPTEAPAKGPRLAIVIDDWGYQAKPVQTLAQLGVLITVSVLPHHPYSAKAAEVGHAAGDEVILHCPMQAQGKIKPEKETLRAGMPADEARRLLAKHWDAIPHAVGLNNHEGSKATEDAALMAVVAEFLKGKNAFFLDSVTTAKSVVPAAAKAAGIPWAARRVFLDNDEKPEAIRKQLRQAVALAKKNGSCIAIGHPHATTLAVLQQDGPALASEGIVLVPVSALLHP